MAAGTSALLLAIGGGVAGVAALTHSDGKPRTVTAVGDAAVPGPAASDGAGAGAAVPEVPSPEQPLQTSVAVPARTPALADRAAGRNQARPPAVIGAPPPAKAQPSPVAPAPRQPARPVITTRTETVTQEIPYPSRTVSDPGMPSGSQRVQTPGVAGEQTLRYLVTLTNGKQTARRLLGSTVTRQPQPEVVAVGDGTDQCGAAIDLCVPISRDPACRHLRRDESAGAGDTPEVTDSAQAGATSQVGVSGNDVAVLSGGHGDGPGDWQGGWHGGGRGRGC